MNDPIAAARETGLQLLNPTSEQLQHGLRLHEESLVCDAYGFGPTAAPDGVALNRLVEAGVAPGLLRDARESMTMTGFLHHDREQREYFRAWEASGVTCVFQNAGVENQAMPETLKRLARYIHVTDCLTPRVRKAVTAEDVARTHQDQQRCLVMTCNAIPLVQSWQYVAEELSYISCFRQLGCRMMHFTYNRRNMFGDGCMEPANAGVSDFGRAAIAAMNRAGVIIDVAHSGHQTSLEVARLSAAPIVASHTAAYALNAHPRNKPDEVIRTIVDKGGVVGVCGIPAFLGQCGDINALLNHVDYIAGNFGVEHVAIGTDVPYQSRYRAEEMSKVTAWPAPKPFEHLWQDEEPLFSPAWNQDSQVHSLAWTNWPLFTVGLVQRGYKDDDIRKIIGGNILRVADSIWRSPPVGPAWSVD